MANEQLEKFVESIEGFSNLDTKTQIDYFGYYLTAIEKRPYFTASDIEECFATLSMRKYSRTSSYLSESAKRRDGSYIKEKLGYKLERNSYSKIKEKIMNEPQMIQVSKQLSELLAQVTDSQEKAFLTEALNCYRVSAHRATIIMIWILAMEHLKNYIFGQKLNEFNNALALNPDKKVKKIVNFDDLSDLQENKLIELMRAANVISNDVRKLLDEKLGIRNSASHPSGITFAGHKTTEFALDIINNILLKY